MKKALVITYHVKNCKRVGGFHYIIKFLNEFGYDIDWLTNPMNVSWFYANNDRANAKNFFDLMKGIEYSENGYRIRNFAVPIWIPQRVASFLGMKLGREYWPSWVNIRKHLSTDYDVIIIEGNSCQYAKEIKGTYPDAKVILRISDILATSSKMENAIEYEKIMIENADVVWCVDESQRDYYVRNGISLDKLDILRNPACTEHDIEYMKNLKPRPKHNGRKRVVYVGVSFVNFDLIEYSAKHNQDADFIVIGPFSRKSHDNVFYMGSKIGIELDNELKNADVGIVPAIEDDFRRENDVRYGYTNKVIKYMKFLLPVVANRSSNYLDARGFITVNTKEEFADAVSRALRIKYEDRAGLKEDYKRVMKHFLESRIRAEFQKYLL